MKKEFRFAVRSSYFTVYRAFKEELEKIGYLWNDTFNEFTERQSKSSNCIFVGNGSWSPTLKGAKAGTALMSFSNHGEEVKVYDLDREFSLAIDDAKLAYKNMSRTSVKLNDQYSADVYEDRVEVGCQTIGRDAMKKLFEAALAHGLID